MENNKKFLTIIVILSVLLVGSLGYITYDKLSNKKDNTNEVKNDNKDNNTKELTVSNAYNYHDYKEAENPCGTMTSGSIDIILPKINSDKPNAKKLNEKILKDFDEYIEISKKEKTNTFVNIYYNYLIKDNYLYINVRGGGHTLCASGSVIRYNYYYDIKNDKILKSKEALTALGYTEKDIFNLNKNGNSYTQEEIKKWSTFEDCDLNNEGGCGCGVEITNNNEFELYNNLQCS